LGSKTANLAAIMRCTKRGTATASPPQRMVEYRRETNLDLGRVNLENPQIRLGEITTEAV
jgi:hypothetical protein